MHGSLSKCRTSRTRQSFRPLPSRSQAECGLREPLWPECSGTIHVWYFKLWDSNIDFSLQNTMLEFLISLILVHEIHESNESWKNWLARSKSKFHSPSPKLFSDKRANFGLVEIYLGFLPLLNHWQGDSLTYQVGSTGNRHSWRDTTV